MDGEFKGKQKRTRKVRSYPVHPLRDALAVAQAIQEANSGLPFDRIVLAGELNTTPSSSSFTMRLNSSVRYGLTLGGYNDARITLTEGGRAIVAPKSEEERRLSLVECALRPQVFRDFYESLEGRRLPEQAYAKNILERDHNIDPDLVEECLDVIVENGKYVGLLREVGGSLWVGVKGVRGEFSGSAVAKERSFSSDANSVDSPNGHELPTSEPAKESAVARVFVGHFGCVELAGQVQALLSDFGIENVAIDVGRRSGTLLSGEVSKALAKCTAAVLVAGSLTEDSGGLEGQAAIGFMAGAAAALFGPRLLVVVSGGRKALDLSVPSVALRPGGEGSASWSLNLLKALNEAGVIRVTA